MGFLRLFVNMPVYNLIMVDWGDLKLDLQIKKKTSLIYILLLLSICLQDSSARAGCFRSRGSESSRIGRDSPPDSGSQSTMTSPRTQDITHGSNSHTQRCPCNIHCRLSGSLPCTPNTGLLTRNPNSMELIANFILKCLALRRLPW